MYADVPVLSRPCFTFSRRRTRFAAATGCCHWRIGALAPFQPVLFDCAQLKFKLTQQTITNKQTNQQPAASKPQSAANK
jgi:hypothetical protein